MTTGSWCLTEILKSWKSCSSKRLASHTALSTSASGVALPYFCSRRGSRRSGVDADAQAHASVACRARDGADLIVELSDVAGIDPNRRASGFDRSEDVLRLEVDVGDDRNLALLRDDVQHIGVVLGRDRNANDVTASRSELSNLLQRAVDVRRLRRGHRLHRDLRLAADADPADSDLSSLPTGSEGHGLGIAEIDRSHAVNGTRSQAVLLA